jgi:hypothetical protein
VPFLAVERVVAVTAEEIVVGQAGGCTIVAGTAVDRIDSRQGAERILVAQRLCSFSRGVWGA